MIARGEIRAILDEQASALLTPSPITPNPEATIKMVDKWAIIGRISLPSSVACGALASQEAGCHAPKPKPGAMLPEPTLHGLASGHGNTGPGSFGRISGARSPSTVASPGV
jgi:hypothetical protein